ncbi:MAG: hypothetical protein PPP58_12255 [Natronomonas sp.]
MVEFTLVELNIGDAQLSAETPWSSKKEVVAGDDPESDEGGSSAGLAVAAVVGLVFLIAVGYAVKRFAEGEDGVDVDVTDEE